MSEGTEANDGDENDEKGNDSPLSSEQEKFIRELAAKTAAKAAVESFVTLEDYRNERESDANEQPAKQADETDDVARENGHVSMFY